MNTRAIVGIIAIILVIPLALVMGQLAATDPVTVAVIFVVVSGALVLYGLGEHMWVLIPASMFMKGHLNFLPGAPYPWQIATLIVGGLTCLGVLTSTRKIHLKITWIEIAVVLQVVAIGQSYLRNPTGLSILGDSVIGGKFYIDYGVSFFAFIILATIKTTPTIIKRAIIAMILIGVADALLKLITSLVPELGFMVMRVYGVTDVKTLMQSMAGGVDLSVSRFTALAPLGSLGMLICCSFWRPVTSLSPTKPLRVLLLSFSTIAILLGGFRGSIASAAVKFGLGSWIRRKPFDAIIVGVIGLMLIFVVVAGVDLRKMPFGVQRTLSFLPVDVSPQARESAEHSTEFRWEMWEAALTSDRYIHNKALGDGFGYSALEQEFILSSLEDRGSMGDIESYLAKGSYHGFHVETIRFTGVLGLVCATFALFVFSVRAWRLTNKYRETSAWGAILFVCIPVIMAPYWYWLVFGSYKVEFPLLIITAGILRIAEQASKGVAPMDSTNEHNEFQKIELDNRPTRV